MNNYNDLPITLTIPEVSQVLGINKAKAYELARREDFPTIQLGRRYIVPKKEFFQWIEEQTKVS